VAFLIQTIKSLNRITKEMREESARVMGEISESFKRQIRQLRTMAIGEINDSVKSIDQRRLYDDQIQSLSEKMLSSIDQIVTSKRKDLICA